MRTLLISTLFFQIIIAVSKAQDPTDPFNWTEPIHLNTSDIFLLWSEGIDAGSL